VSVFVDGNATHARAMLEKLQQRGARRGVTILEASRARFDLRVIVQARGPQWRTIFGVSASGAVAVLGANGDLLFMEIRQKETSAGGALDRLADAILERLPALLRGERLIAVMTHDVHGIFRKFRARGAANAGRPQRARRRSPPGSRPDMGYARVLR